MLERLIATSGTSAEPRLRREQGEEAASEVIGGISYIVYDPEFLADLNDAAETEWAAVSVIAHELGHHHFGHVRSGHEVLAPADMRREELDADYFAGYTLARMGASLADAEAALDFIRGDRASDTHPGTGRRLRATAAGWADGRDGLPLVDHPAHP